MLTIFTGGPGAGKTAALVDLLLQLPGDRPIYNDGLTDLDLPGKIIHPVDAMDWHNVVPDGGIIVVDEVQRRWRPRGPAAAVPPSIQALETHRHRGIDIFVTTQAPRLVDANVRALCTRHVHLRDTGWAGRHWYEWPEISDQMAWKTCVNKRSYKLPTAAFSHYKSSELHTKPIRKTPKALYLVIALVIGLLVLVFMVYRSISSKLAPEAVKAAPHVTSSLATGGAPAGSSGVAKVIDDRVDWIPRVSSRPESAPAFDDVRKVAVMPIIVGCASFAGKARCFTQQGTDAGLDHREAQLMLETPRFNPYDSRERAEVRPTPPSVEKTSPGASHGTGLIVIDGEQRSLPQAKSSLGAARS